MRYCLDIPFVFGENVERKFDLIMPENPTTPPPLIMWIHGGAWAGGEKRIGNDFERFCYRGYAVLAISYRFISEAPFPAQLIDCKTALRWARAHAEEYGYNADRVIVGGNSAGGHLASLMGTTNGEKVFDCEGGYYEYSSDVQAVVDEFGPIDLYELIHVKDYCLESQLNTMLSSSFGEIDGFEEMAKYASPNYHIDGTEPPFLILQGSADPTVPVEQSRNFHRQLLQAGVNAEYYEVEGGDHGFDDLEAYYRLTRFIETQSPVKQ